MVARQAITVPGLNRGVGIPAGYILGRTGLGGHGPVQLLALHDLQGIGVATNDTVQTQSSTDVSTALSSTTSAITAQSALDSTALSSGLSTTLSSALSAVTSLSSALSGGVTAGPFTTVTGIRVVNGIVVSLAGT